MRPLRQVTVAQRTKITGLCMMQITAQLALRSCPNVAMLVRRAVAPSYSSADLQIVGSSWTKGYRGTRRRARPDRPGSVVPRAVGLS